jgi:hypothetical protein
MQADVQSGHPGEALGFGAVLLGMSLNPESEEADSAEALARADALEQRFSRLEQGAHIDQLPNADRAIIDLPKFQDYSMDEGNAQNLGKAGGWKALGYNVDSPKDRAASAQDASSQLAAQLPNAQAQFTGSTQYGVKFRVLTEIVGPNGRTGTLVTVWQYDKGSDVPRLITPYVITGKPTGG